MDDELLYAIEFCILKLVEGKLFGSEDKKTAIWNSRQYES